MIQFNINKFHVEHVYMKYITKSLGGSMSVLDTTNTSDKEKFKKIEIPTHVADVFIREYMMSRFIKPILTAVCYYGDTVVGLELHPMGNAGQEYVETLFGKKYWESNIVRNINGMITEKTAEGRWFIDGSVVYQFNDKAPVDLSKDKRFQALEVDAFRMSDFNMSTIVPNVRTCIAYQAENGSTTISPPIWRTMGSIGDKKVDHLSEDDAITLGITEHQFDKVERLLAVNLNFALRAGKVLTDHFGYDSIEPLRLDNLMIQLKTVNLSKIDKSIKSTHDIGLKFTHAIAWVIGLGARDMTLESYTAVRSILRYLTSRGIVYKSALSKTNVFHKDMDMKDVPLLDSSKLSEMRTANKDEIADILSDDVELRLTQEG